MALDTRETERPARGWTGGIGYQELGVWLLVVVALVADVLSTAYGITHGQTEGNPLVRAALAYGGVAAFSSLKLAVVAVGWVAWAAMSHRHRIVIPLGIALPWAVVAVLNVVTILA